MDSSNPISIFLASIFTHNIALVYILGMCPFIVISKSYKSAVSMGIALIFVVSITAVLNWFIYWFILVPTGSEMLSFLIFIVVIASTVQLLEMIIERFFPRLQISFGIFLPLVTVNCVVLAVSLFMVLRGYNFVQTVAYSIGTAVGWALAITLMSAIREKLSLVGDIPKGLQGPGITMIITGIMALAFMGFAGIVKL